MIRHVIGASAIAIAVLLGSATAAGAIQLTPTDWRSSIVSVTPDTPFMHLEVVGGDAGLRLAVDEGHTVIVPGYQNEPYLRINADGTVDVNERSPAASLNRSRTGTSSSANSDANAEPDWHRIGGAGSVVWHDHRTHAMPGVNTDIDWTLTFTADGQPVVTQGHLARLPGHSPIPELLAGLATLAFTVVVGLRDPLRVASFAALGASAIATAVSTAAWVATPDGFSRPWAPTLVAATALVLAIIVATPGRPTGRARLVALLVSVALSAGCVALGLPTLTAAIVPGGPGAVATRFAVAIAGGLVLAAAGLAVLSGGFATESSGSIPPQADVANGA